MKTIEITSPLEGEVIDQDQLMDEALASGSMGLGAAIIPSKGIVYAPADGLVFELGPGNTSLGMRTQEGIEIYIEVGHDTVTLAGDGFDLLVSEGQEVRQGQELMSIDLDLLKSQDYDPATAVFVSNHKDYKGLRVIEDGPIEAGDLIIEVDL